MLKTGPPMYEIKYNNSRSINNKTDIYRLDLENGKKYIHKVKKLIE